ncbi:M20 family metallopeptidase [Halalkaliarchaeum desulfuricum]|nr:M20/M25/M40 family metallo-hydrolase [Halalkaliarchaeum desulfuricum]
MNDTPGGGDERAFDGEAAHGELVSLARRLVEIPSHDDETAAGDAIERWLRGETGAVVERDGAGNVLARRTPPGVPADDIRNDERPTFALVGHHDVVPPAQSQVAAGTVESADSYAVDRRDGRLYGRGTADMKGAVAACLLAFRDADLGGDGAGAGGEAPDLAFASFVGEETGGEGARAAIDDGFVPDYALVAEGSTNYSKAGVTDVAVAHKGRRASRLLARGTAAHASEPDRGENAIYRASDAVDVVRELPFPQAEVLGERLQATLAVTEIDGGSAWNVIPERCEITVDERTVPGKRADLERATELPGVDLEIDQDLPPMACSDDAFAEQILEAARTAQTGTPEHVTKPHATDAGWLAAAGTACVVCGPAEPGEAHTDTESVSIDVLERCYRIYRGAAERVSRESGET